MPKNLVIIVSIVLNIILIIVFSKGKDLAVNKKYILIEAEKFTDSNNNNIWDKGEEFFDCGLDDNDMKICNSDKGWQDKYGNGKWDNDINAYIEEFNDKSGDIKEKRIYFQQHLDPIRASVIIKISLYIRMRYRY